MVFRQTRKQTVVIPKPGTTRPAFWLLSLIFILTACTTTTETPQPATVDPGPFYTQAAQTMAADLTSQAPAQTPTSLPSQTPPPPTLTPTSTVSPTTTLSASPPATHTSIPLPTDTPIPCNRAEFLGDLSTTIGTTFYPGQEFVRSWLVHNSGRCTWNPDYRIQFVSGDPMGYTAPFSFTNFVLPDESTVLNVILTAPSFSGIHRSGWMLRSDRGELFGIGPSGEEPLWIEIQVVEPPASYYDNFASSYCAASWENESGSLPCPGNTSSFNGFVMRLESADLENRREDEPLIWTQPSTNTNSWIRGIFPAIRIEDDDFFLADIGCLAGYPDCDVVFQLNYRIPGGVITNLGEWREVADGDITRVNIDLSNLAGRSVELILTTLSNGSSTDDAAFWLMPRIENR